MPHSLVRLFRLDKYFWSHRRRRNSMSAANKKYSEDIKQILERSEAIKDSDSSVDEDDNDGKGQEEGGEEDAATKKQD